MPYTQFGDFIKAGGEVTESAPRRKDTYFFEKYLKGKKDVLEIGGMEDPIVNWATHYDQHHETNMDVDATFCKELESEKYDVVHASHVLEHIANCYLGLKNWFRLVKKGGLLIFTVPHVDLYERKNELPSEGNPDHKFFIHDGEERLPFVLNLSSLIKGAFLDYEYKIHEYHVCKNPDFDFENTKWPTPPMCEYQIEVVIEKL